MNIHERMGTEIVNDYFTANIKSEVLIDTLLTPIIGDILTIIGQHIGIKGKMQVLAKEFPMMKNGNIDETDFRNCNADYLMSDENTVYLD